MTLRKHNKKEKCSTTKTSTGFKKKKTFLRPKTVTILSKSVVKHVTVTKWKDLGNEGSKYSGSMFSQSHCKLHKTLHRAYEW